MNTPILRLLGTALGVGLCLLLSSCGGSKPVLHVYNWSDYFAEGLLKEFEERYDCRVVLDTYDSNEMMLGKLKSGASGYDVIFPSSYMIPLMVANGLLLELDKDSIPNLRHVDPAFLANVALDKAMRHSVPYMSGTTGIAYRRDIVSDFVPSWTMFGRADLGGRMTLLDDPREVIGAALKVLGHSVNSTDPAAINAAADLVISWKRNLARFDSEGYKAGIASREFYVVQGYGGDVQQVIDENEDPEIVFALPREGFVMWEDVVAIPSTADNVELALAFINFLHEPEIAARNISEVYYLCPNVGAYPLLDDEIRANPVVFIPNELLVKGEQLIDVGDDLALYTAAWDRIKAE
jgi:spermidine/putrescine transport system substrate-binding protein